MWAELARGYCPHGLTDNETRNQSRQRNTLSDLAFPETRVPSAHDLAPEFTLAAVLCGVEVRGSSDPDRMNAQCFHGHVSDFERCFALLKVISSQTPGCLSSVAQHSISQCLRWYKMSDEF